MADDNTSTELPITDKAPLIDYMASGCKPPEEWRIGTEHEKFVFHRDSLRPLTYDEPNGIRKILVELIPHGWDPVIEDKHIVALTKADKSSITLEPAGQLELSGAPLETIHQTCKEVSQHLQQVKKIATEMNIGFLGLGYNPKWAQSEMPWMPKGRYKLMQEYMPKRGTFGLHMMQNTCTVQVNLDFCSEERMVQMFRISLALQPIATALFANSPFREGKPTGYLSYRSHMWTDTDPDRCGMLPFVFEDGFGFERYVDYMLDVPMYFVYRNGEYINATGQSFRDFMAGKLPALPGEYPTIKDWEDHLSTAFPEVRLKKFMEMRGTDGGPWNRLCALPAFWVGLLYDATARDAAWELVKDWTFNEMEAMRAEVPRTALNTAFRNGTVGDLALDALEISHEGLTRRAKLDGLGLDETHFLKPLFQIAQADYTPAEDLLRAYEGRWHGCIDPVFKEYAY